MKNNEWKVGIGLWCECPISDVNDLSLYYITEIPFIPKVGEYLWMDEDCDNFFEGKVMECFNRMRCDDCPFICEDEEGPYANMDDSIIVRLVIYDCKEKIVKVNINSDLAENLFK